MTLFNHSLSIQKSIFQSKNRRNGSTLGKSEGVITHTKCLPLSRPFEIEPEIVSLIRLILQ